MSGVAVAIAVMVSAWNPGLFAERSGTPSQRRLFGWAAGSGAVLALAALTGPILEAIDVSVPTFRTAAGTVLALVGARWLIGSTPRRDEGDDLAHGAMDVGTPEIAAAAMTTTAVDGWLMAVIGLVLAVALTSVLGRFADAPWIGWLRRLLAGLAVTIGVALIYAGIRSV